jgi:NADPH:quinone reductase-like Zn-dependent oxidoreductase
MATTMNAVVLERFGEPAEVLKVRQTPIPEPGPGEVRVRMIASPINPSDLLMVRGRYVQLPTPPAIPGFEGVGVVDKAGSGLLGRWVQGKRVTVLNHRGGNWAEYAVIPARQARPVPSDIPDEQVASFFVNPATALALVRHVLKVPRGAWLLQSAAGSALGTMIIRLGRRDGFKTINVVRRREAMEPLRRLGADAVICSTDAAVDDQVRELVGEEGVRYALDPVGGETGTQVCRSLGRGGRLILYGSLSDEPIRIDNRHLIRECLTIEGFWLGHWMRDRSIPAALKLFREIATLIRAGILTTQIGPVLPMTRLDEALQAAESSQAGKALLDLGLK